jgi:putative ABC transport system permease protein
MMMQSATKQPNTNYKIANAPLYRTAWRRMQRRPFQYVLFIIGIALGVAMMVSIDLANGSASRAFALSTDAIAGKTTHRIVGGPTGIDESIYTRLRNELGYTLSAPVVEGTVSSAALGDIPYTLVGIDAFAEPPFRSYLGGQAGGGVGLSAFIALPNAVLISAEIAQSQNLALGDTIPLEIAGRTFDATIVGLIDPADDLTRRGLQGLIFSDIASAQEMFGKIGTLSRIDLIAENEAALDPIRAILPAGVQIEPAAARSNAIQQMTAAFELNLTALSLLALVVGMFLIYNTVTFSVVQRRPLFGILRALGVTGRQLATLILSEAAVLGLIGSIIGIGVGIVLGRAMVGLVTQTINDLYFTVTVRTISIPPFTIIKGLIIGMAAALLASIPPAIEAMQTAPSTIMRRSTLESRIHNLLPYFVLGWAIMATLGALLLWSNIGGLVVAFGGLFAVLFAFALITPPVTVWLMNRIQRLMERWGGAIGRMAPRDITRSLSRTSVAIAALMTAVSVIIGVSIMIGSFRQTVVQWLDQTLQADVYISPPSSSSTTIEGTLDPAAIAIARAHPDVELAITARNVRIFAPQFERSVNVAAIDGDIARGNRPFKWIANNGTEADAMAALDAGEGIIISEPLLRRENLSLPPVPITLLTEDGEREFPVVAVFFDYTSDQGYIWIGSDSYERLWNDPAKSTVALFARAGADIDQIVADLQAEIAPIQSLEIRSNAALRQVSIEIFDRTFAITAALRLLATVVAFIGVLSALMSLQLERARELATLRATGMTTRQLWQLTLLETGLMGAVAGLIAIPTGYALAWVLIYVINVRSFGWTLQLFLQPSYFINALLVAIVAALLAGIYPSIRLGRMVIASAIRSE